MARYRLLITLAIVSLAFAAYGDQPVFAPRDPSAARKDFSNVDPSTAIDALNLGTMATEASADYVATGTFTGHTGDASDPHGATLTQTTIISDSVDGVDVSAHVTDNSDVHGCTAVASASAVADALSAASALIPNNASFTLAGLSEKSYWSLADRPTFGTMASETATDYLKVADLPAYPANASFTLAGLSEKSYWSLTGLPSFGTMASETATSYALKTDIDDLSGVTDAATARTNLGVAASSSTVLTSGANAMTGSLKFSGNYGILQSTSDGSDSGWVSIGGGGAFSVSRGAYLWLLGNEYASVGGQAQYYAGNVSTGDHVFYTGSGVEQFRIGYDGMLTAANYLRFSSNYGIARATVDGSDNSWINICGGGSYGSSRGGTIEVFGNEMTSSLGGCIRYDTGKVTGACHIFRVKDVEVLQVGSNVLIGTTTDDGTNKLQVNGPVYVASYVSALGYIDRTEAPDTLAEAYAIVQSHEVTAAGELDHAKLHPAAWGKRVELQPTGKTITRVVEEPIKDAEPLEDGKVPTKEITIEEPEMQQIVVPDQSGRDLSMVISAQALVIKDLTKRIEALEAR